MKSQINLLHNEFMPKFEWICANHLVGLLIAVILLCSGTYGLSAYFLKQKERQVAAIKQDIKQQQKRTDELTRALTDRVTNPLLQSKLASFTEQTRARRVLLKHIRNLSSLKQRSFSVLFDSFSQSSSSELWLTHFLVTPNELSIEGKITKPGALPAWIGQLSKTDFFKGQEFNLASVDRKESELIFTLTSVDKSLVETLASAEVIDEE
jgi:Tfp pilus assembly protein PilN